MMIKRAIAIRGGCAGKIQGAGHTQTAKCRHCLDHIGIIAFGIAANNRRQSGNIDCRIGKRVKYRADIGRIDGGKVALHINHGIVFFIGVKTCQGLMHPVRARWQVRVGQNCNAAGLFNRLGNFGFRTGDDHRPDFGLNRTPPDMHDHGFAVNIGQRFVG